MLPFRNRTTAAKTDPTGHCHDTADFADSKEYAEAVAE